MNDKIRSFLAYLFVLGMVVYCIYRGYQTAGEPDLKMMAILCFITLLIIWYVSYSSQNRSDLQFNKLLSIPDHGERIKKLLESRDKKKINISDGEYFKHISWAYAFNGDPDHALKYIAYASDYFENAKKVTLELNNCQCYNIQFLLLHNEYDKARDLYLKAEQVAYRPKFMKIKELNMKLANAQIELSNPDNNIETLKQCIRSITEEKAIANGNSLSEVLQARIDIINGEKDKAIQKLERSIMQCPDYFIRKRALDMRIALAGM